MNTSETTDTIGHRGQLDGQENEDTKVQREILATQANQATQVSRVKEAEGVQLVLQVHLAHRVFLVELDWVTLITYDMSII